MPEFVAKRRRTASSVRRKPGSISPNRGHLRAGAPVCEQEHDVALNQRCRWFAFVAPPCSVAPRRGLVVAESCTQLRPGALGLLRSSVNVMSPSSRRSGRSQSVVRSASSRRPSAVPATAAAVGANWQAHSRQQGVRCLLRHQVHDRFHEHRTAHPCSPDTVGRSHGETVPTANGPIEMQLRVGAGEMQRRGDRADVPGTVRRRARTPDVMSGRCSTRPPRRMAAVGLDQPMPSECLDLDRLASGVRAHGFD